MRNLVKATPALALSFACLAATPLGAYPIPPVTLWELVRTADPVLLAKVERIEAGSDEPYRPTEAVLSVKEVWKGEPLKECRVQYEPNIICPAPPRYVAGETVLAFLEKEKTGWSTVGLSYGTLYPRAQDRGDFRKAVDSARKLQIGGVVSEAAKRDWLVDTASRRSTRWHGLYELVPAADRLHSYYDRERPKEPSRLAPSQLERLAAGFVSEPDLGPTFPMMLEVLRDHRSARVDATAVALVERLLEGKTLPRWADQAMALVIERFRMTHDLAEKKPDEPVLEDPLLSEREKTDDELRTIWKGVRPRMKVQPVKLPDLPARGARGVGEHTPP